PGEDAASLYGPRGCWRRPPAPAKWASGALVPHSNATLSRFGRRGPPRAAVRHHGYPDSVQREHVGPGHEPGDARWPTAPPGTGKAAQDRRLHGPRGGDGRGPGGGDPAVARCHPRLTRAEGRGAARSCWARGRIPAPVADGRHDPAGVTRRWASRSSRRHSPMGVTVQAASLADG